MKFLILILLIVSCSTRSTQLSDKAKDLEVYSSKPSECRVTGRVTGKNLEGSKELALNDAINQAAELDSSGIFVNQEVPNGSVMSVHATAYQCE